MVIRPTRFNAYEFVVVSALRTHQLRMGSVPRVGGDHNSATTAQLEVAEGCVQRAADSATATDAPAQCLWQR